MLKVIALGASSSKNSINQQLAVWVANQIKNAEVEVLSLIDFEMPIYSIDKEINGELPTLAKDFASKIDSADVIVLSLAEHNGSYTSAFKNSMDWVSRIPNRKIWGDKKMIVLSTSPGPRGAVSVLEAAINRFPFDGGTIVGKLSLPSFNTNFSIEKGIINAEIKNELKKIIEKLG